MAQKDFTVKEIQDDRYIVVEVETAVPTTDGTFIDTWKLKVPDDVLSQKDLECFMFDEIEKYENASLPDQKKEVETVKISEEIDAAVGRQLTAEAKVDKLEVGEINAEIASK